MVWFPPPPVVVVVVVGGICLYGVYGSYIYIWYICYTYICYTYICYIYIYVYIWCIWIIWFLRWVHSGTPPFQNERAQIEKCNTLTRHRASGDFDVVPTVAQGWTKGAAAGFRASWVMSPSPCRRLLLCGGAALRCSGVLLLRLLLLVLPMGRMI